MRRAIWAFWKLVLFRVDAEAMHKFLFMMTRAACRLGRPFGQAPLRMVSGAWREPAAPGEGPRVFGLEFASRVGLAAGFDKDSAVLEALPALGFGFAEIGTVTPRPQPGNPRPRLLRDPARHALFNRMGFNSLGATIVASRLGKAREHLPERFRVGVNLGKNRDTALDDAPADYARVAAAFEGLADYLVVNVSSPNTPGLRALQEPERLERLVGEVTRVISAWKKAPPLLLKLAPELGADALAEIGARAAQWGVGGLVLTNTLAGSAKLGGGDVAGGWSGMPLLEPARASLIAARAATALPIVSVGGIMDAEEARRRLAHGADLVQLYTGWVYAGPSLPAEIARKTAEKRQKKSPGPAPRAS